MTDITLDSISAKTSDDEAVFTHAEVAFLLARIESLLSLQDGINAAGEAVETARSEARAAWRAVEETRRRARAAEAVADRLHAILTAVAAWGREQAKPFADGVPDREGQAAWEALREVLYPGAVVKAVPAPDPTSLTPEHVRQTLADWFEENLTYERYENWDDNAFASGLYGDVLGPLLAHAIAVEHRAASLRDLNERLETVLASLPDADLTRPPLAEVAETCRAIRLLDQDADLQGAGPVTPGSPS